MNTAGHRSFVLAGFVAASSLFIACEPPPQVRPGLAPQTSRMGISKGGETLFIAMADHDEVRAVDAATGETTKSVAVVGHPHRLTVLQDGTVAVTARYSGTVSVLDMSTGETLFTTEVGSDPFGVVEVGDELWVAVAGEGDLARIALADGRVTSRVALESDDPRGLAVSGGRLIVSHFSAGRLSVVDVDSGTVEQQVGMKLPSRSFFTPNQIDQITVNPADPNVVVAPHVECNNDPAQFSTGGGAAFVGTSAAVYYNSGPTGFPAVVPGVSRADVVVGVITSDDSNDPAQAGFEAEPLGATSPIMNPLNRTLLEDQLVNTPVAVALADDGALELVVALGSGNVIVRRSQVAKGHDSVLATVDVGVGAEAIVLSPDGGTAYVFNGFAQTVSSFAVPELAKNGDTRFEAAPDQDTEQFFTGIRHEPIQHLKAKTFVVAEQALPANVVRGRELFHAVDQRLTQNGAISCASCHPGGGDDGTTWSFAEGPRQSPALWGGLIGTEPFHWDQAVRDMADISRVTVIGRMGGSGLGRTDMDAIGAFLDTIPAPAARVTAAELGESVSRGADLFTSMSCTTCHAGADFTAVGMHDVGTGRSTTTRETVDVFAIPPLKGLIHSGPYLHDGSARTVRDVIEKLVVTNKMLTAEMRAAGVDGSTLSEQDITDLVAFLESL
ncbi:MAG: PQQ-binding-like beta-propeller repeat protein [Deltaproteobacteria bacterium]|nr:PQQ-binding-like beta-propeller repeat protein [Deltaproteobacteria bacterium]